jgi:hypothetical protein
MAEEKNGRKIWRKITLVALYLFIFSLLLKNSFSYLDPDFGWHFKTGEAIWQNRAVPDINNEDYTLLGTHWVDHEWLAELFIYSVNHSLGYVAVNIAFALIIIAALLVQFWTAKKYFLRDGRGIWIVFILQTLGVYASLPHFGVRAQEFTVLGLSLLLAIIFSYNRSGNHFRLWWLLPLFFLWVGAHAGFLIGLFVLGLYAAAKAAENILTPKFSNFLENDWRLSWRQIGIFVLFSVLAVLATLATPYGWHLYGFLWQYRDNYYQSHLSEWQGQYCFPLIYGQLAYIEIVLIFFALNIFDFFYNLKSQDKRRINLFGAAITVIFVFLAFKARRHFPLLLMVSLPFVVYFFVDFWPKISFDKPRSGIKKTASVFLVIIKIAAPLGLLAMAIFIFFQINFTAHPEVFYKLSYPAEAVDFLKQHPEWDKLNIFNEYAWGGFLLWQYPERKLFLDGRLPQYPMSGNTALREYDDFFDKDKVSGQLRKYDIGIALLKSAKYYPPIRGWEKKFFSLNEKDVNNAIDISYSLQEYLSGSDDWRKVYDDGTAEIFVAAKFLNQ